MISNQEYVVTMPPTSAEVERSTVDVLLKGGILPLELLPLRQIPKPVTELVKLRIHQTLHPNLGGMVIGGTLENVAELNSCIVTTDPDSNLPARATIVRPVN